MNEALERFEYHVWANERMFRHLDGLPGELWRSRIESVFPAVAEALTHMYQTDYVWFRTMAGDGFDEVSAGVARLREESAEDGPAELERRYRELTGQFRAFLAEADLIELRSYHHPSFGTLRASHSELVTHVVNHGTYHRGNITAMLRQQGHPGPATDFVYYLFLLKR